jgi:hypothetical protein
MFRGNYVPIIKRKYRTYATPGICHSVYRVSIKSFPDYKRLLQENYVEYKHIFFFKM